MTGFSSPALTEDTRPFWTGGLSGKLLICRCTQCERYVHPPQPVCPICWGDSIAPVPVSGRGKIHSYTVNHHPWVAGQGVPFVFAAIELVEQEGLYVMSRLINLPNGSVSIGAEVAVVFETRGEISLPLFELVDR